MRTAFVTGGTGFLGLNIVEALMTAGYRVIAIHRGSSNTKYLAALGAELRVAALEKRDALLEVMPDGIDAVFHVAGDISWWKGHAERQRKTNVDGTRNVVEAALARGAKRFIHTSSVTAFGLGSPHIDERTPSTAMGSGIGYFETKWLGEQEVRRGLAQGLDAVILNPANIIGPYDQTSWARLFVQIRNGKLPGVPPGSGSFCDAHATARAHLAAVEKARRGEQYILAGADAPYVELTRLMAECVGKPAPRALPAPLVRLFGQVQDVISTFTRKEADITSANARLLSARFSADCTKAQRELDFEVVPLEAMVRSSYEWLRTEGLI
jgi:nucleoside-diphosphate-sugar epimerase